jgi:hypothetical protein
LFLQKYLGPLTQKLRSLGKNTWELWKISAVYTVVSFLSLIVWFSFYQNLESWKKDLFYSSLVVFLFGATVWSLSISNIKKGNTKGLLGSQKTWLYTSALGSIGMLISTVYSTDSWFLIVAASIVAFHHVVFDAIIWPNAGI